MENEQINEIIKTQKDIERNGERGVEGGGEPGGRGRRDGGKGKESVRGNHINKTDFTEWSGVAYPY